MQPTFLRTPARRVVAVVLAALLALACAAPAGMAMGTRTGDAPAAADEPLEPGSYVPGEVLVRFKEGVTEAQRDALLASLEMRVKKPLGLERAYLLAIGDGVSVTAAVRRLEASELVEYAEPNRIVRLDPPEGRPAPERLRRQ